MISLLPVDAFVAVGYCEIACVSKMFGVQTIMSAQCLNNVC